MCVLVIPVSQGLEKSLEHSRWSIHICQLEEGCVQVPSIHLGDTGFEMKGPLCSRMA